MFRIQGMIDPYDAMGLPTFGASGGITASPFDELKISVEGKAMRVAGEWVPGVYTALTLKRPEPPPYSAKYEEEEEEAASAGPGRRVDPAPPAVGPAIATRPR
jgi:hypothetical protein